VYPQPFFTGQYSQGFILGNHQPSLRNSVCKSSSHAGLYSPAYSHTVTARLKVVPVQNKALTQILKPIAV
jgi:hypothetical protein